MAVDDAGVCACRREGHNEIPVMIRNRWRMSIFECNAEAMGRFIDLLPDRRILDGPEWYPCPTLLLVAHGQLSDHCR